jgi:hypothetical protein
MASRNDVETIPRRRHLTLVPDLEEPFSMRFDDSLLPPLPRSA